MPGLTRPLSSTRSPLPNRRGMPNRCRRAISSAVSTGKVCARRASRVGETAGALTRRISSPRRHRAHAPATGRRRIRVARAAAQQVPALVELDLQRGQALALLVRPFAALEELVLLLHEMLD